MFVFQRGLDDRAYREEHFALLDRMRPDMARASLATMRLGLERARGTVEAMAMIGLPAGSPGRLAAPGFTSVCSEVNTPRARSLWHRCRRR